MREAYLEHENAKTELKALMPENAKEAIGHGIRAKRSKSGAVSFDVLSLEAGHLVCRLSIEVVLGSRPTSRAKLRNAPAT